MARKKSLGHNPLAYRMMNAPSLEFIAPIEKPAETKEEKKVKKRIVSYYLEDALVNEIKSRAEEENQSYSSFVSEAIRLAIKDNG